MEMLPPPPAKHITLRYRVILAYSEKKRVRLATYIREGCELQEDRASDYDCSSATQGFRWFLLKSNSSASGTVLYYLNHAGQPSAQLFQLMYPIVCQWKQDAMRQWYSTVHIRYKRQGS